MQLPPYDARQEAIALTNQLYYRDGVPPKPLALADAKLVQDTIAEALIKAFTMGKGTVIREQFGAD